MQEASFKQITLTCFREGGFNCEQRWQSPFCPWRSHREGGVGVGIEKVLGAYRILGPLCRRKHPFQRQGITKGEQGKLRGRTSPGQGGGRGERTLEDENFLMWPDDKLSFMTQRIQYSVLILADMFQK